VTDPRVEIAPQESGRPLATVLLERNYAGLKVEISYHRDLESLHLFVQEGENIGKVCTIGEGEVRDAFEHPYLYLQRAGLA
jgi:hypothetical protein